MMRNVFVFLGVLLFIGTAFANGGIPDPYMNARYQSIYCYADSSDYLISFAQAYYIDQALTPPAYLEEYRTELWDGMSAMYGYGVAGNLVAFNAQASAVMSTVNSIKSAYRHEARTAILNGWESRGDITADYGMARGALASCLGGGD